MSCQCLNVAVAHLVKLVLPHILIAPWQWFCMSSFSKDGSFFFNGKLREHENPSLF